MFIYNYKLRYFVDFIKTFRASRSCCTQKEAVAKGSERREGKEKTGEKAESACPCLWVLLE
jgi:hypothetical protein